MGRFPVRSGVSWTVVLKPQVSAPSYPAQAQVAEPIALTENTGLVCHWPSLTAVSLPLLSCECVRPGQVLLLWTAVW